MQGPDSSYYEITDPRTGAEKFRDAAKWYEGIAADAAGAAARTLDRGEYVACQTAIRVAEQALCWTEAMCAKAEAWETVAWAELQTLGEMANAHAKAEAFRAAGRAAVEARILVMLGREHVADCMRVRRAQSMAPSCTAETLCLGALE